MLFNKKLMTFSLVTTLSFMTVNVTFAKNPQQEQQEKVSALLNQMPYSWQGKIDGLTLHTVGESGLLKKYQIIDEAMSGTTINMAYFIFDNDFTSSQIAQKLIKAKARGVNVRLLVDYFMTESYKDWLKYLVAKGIEIKRYNPGSSEFRSFLTNDLQVADAEAFIGAVALQDSHKMSTELMTSPLLMQKMTAIAPILVAAKTQEPAQDPMILISNLEKALNQEDRVLAQKFAKYMFEITYRMHHKILMGETKNGLEYINGGRNLSDEYHLSLGNDLLKERKYPFFDAENSGIINEGKVQFLNNYEEMWNSKAIQQVQAFDPNNKADKLKMDEIQKSVNEKLTALNLPAQQKLIQNNAKTGSFQVSPAVSVNYVENRPLEGSHKTDINEGWQKIISTAHKSVTIVSAYLLLKDLEGQSNLLTALEAAAKNGAEIKLYTNSFATTDMNIVNVGSYKVFDSWKTKLGPKFKMYELDKPYGQGSLHAKIINVDGRIIGVGSANSDPRSLILDSNNLMIMDFSAISVQAAKFFEAYVSAAGPAQPSRLGLKWKELTSELAAQKLKEIKENKDAASTLRVLAIPGIEVQL